MATQIKMRRGTTSQHSSFTGAEGEVTIDTDKEVAVVHNGSTAGGFPLLSSTGGTITGDTTFANGADIITASAGTSNFRAGVNAGNSIASGGNYNVCVGDEAGTTITLADHNTLVGFNS